MRRVVLAMLFGLALTVGANSALGQEMVLVPAGEFWMGSTRSEVNAAIVECTRDESGDICREFTERELPRHRVMLDAFYIDKLEVTNALFELFVRATGYATTAEREGWGWVWNGSELVEVNGASWRAPTGPGSFGDPGMPVVQISWYDAEAYCRWAGKRLPSEAEWEKAARGTDARKYPWGESWDSLKANGANAVKAITPASSYAAGASPYGALNMVGNVAEWVADWFNQTYYQQSPERNPRGPQSGQVRALRGGSWRSAPFNLRAAYRYNFRPDFRNDAFGVRCARGQ